MKKFLSLLLSLAMLLSVAALADETHGNYSDEMKIPYAVDLSPEDGADSVERAGDHVDSPYFSRLDFYNMTSTDTLTILPHFQTMQQTSEWSCGVVSALMVMNWYGKLGDYNEQTLAQLRGTIGDKPGATSMSQMVDIFNGVGGRGSCGYLHLRVHPAAAGGGQPHHDWLERLGRPLAGHHRLRHDGHGNHAG